MLVVNYSPLLLFASSLLALMSAFTGLILTNGLSERTAEARKKIIVQAAIVLGGGIWSTHFVAMLALDLPVLAVAGFLLVMFSEPIAHLLLGDVGHASLIPLVAVTVITRYLTPQLYAARAADRRAAATVLGLVERDVGVDQEFARVRSVCEVIAESDTGAKA